MRSLLVVAILGLAMVPADAQVVRQLTDSKLTQFRLPRVTADGSLAFVVSTGDLTGENPDGRAQLFRIDLISGMTTQITSLPLGVVSSSLATTAISGDGSRVAFVSAEDLTGQNAERNREIFLMDADGGNLAQVTDAGDDYGGIDHIELTPDGSRFAFSASFNYLGQNPDHEFRAWVVDADGGGLTGVSSGFGLRPSISADGQRVVFGGGTIFAVEADGSNERQLTTWSSGGARISADGSTVSFLGTGALPNQGAGWCFGGQQLGIVDWDGSNPLKASGLCLGNAFPGDVYWGDLAPDGQHAYYVGSDLFGVVRRVDRDVTTETVLAPPNGPCERVGVAADESRVAVTCTGDLAGTNPDRNKELYAVEGDGSAVVQRTFTPASGDSQSPSIALDTDAVVFTSDANLLDEDPHPGRQLYRIAVDGSGLERITSIVDDAAVQPDTTADGGLTVFTVDELYTDYHQLHTVSTPGGVVAAIADPSFNFITPAISADAGRIVAVEGFSNTIYAMGPDGSGLTALGIGTGPRLDGSGAKMVFGRAFSEVWIHDFAGGMEQQLATGAAPDISRDGQRIAFRSDTDPFGTNADGNFEIFGMLADGSQLRQLTVSADYDNSDPTFSGDGRYVYHVIEYSYFRDLYRVDFETGQAERVGGLQCVLPPFGRRIDVNQNGALAVYSGGADCAGRNPDGNDEIYVIDRAATPVLRLGPERPTAVRWDAGSGPVGYDVIRGGIASLAPGGVLGAVLCIENDSIDNSTLGSPDPAEPSPGQGFFYLVRDFPGGDYGRDSTAALRVPSSGDCPN